MSHDHETLNYSLPMHHILALSSASNIASAWIGLERRSAVRLRDDLQQKPTPLRPAKSLVVEHGDTDKPRLKRLVTLVGFHNMWWDSS
jgi:hypothetical protein